MRPSWRYPAVALVCILATASCKNAIESGHNTALDAVDLVAMTDDMAMQIGSDPDIVREYDQRGPLKIVVQPVVNEMTAQILPIGPATAFTARVRVLLAKHAPERFTWVMNRDAFRRLQARELDGIDPGPSPDRIQPEYALTATFRTLTSEDPKRRSDYYLCVYKLTSLQSGAEFWTGSYEVKKIAVKGFLD